MRQPVDAADKEPGPREEDDRHRELDHDEALRKRQPVPRAVRGRAAAARLQGGGRITPGGHPGRDGAEEGAREERDAEGEGNDPEVEGHVHVEESRDEALAPHGGRDAEGPAEGGDDHALEEEHPDEAPPLAAEGQPNGDLLAAPGGAHTLQVGQVDARDQEHEAREGDGHPRELGAVITELVPGVLDDGVAAFLVGLGVVVGEALLRRPPSPPAPA